jgi:excisionase family DNA binding protein
VLNLDEAAKETRLSKSAVWRAVNSGRLPATRTFAGDYRIDPAELHRIFPPGAELATDVSPIVVSMRRDPTELERAEAASMQEQIERLFEVGRQIRKELDDAATSSTPPPAPA